MQAHVRDGGKEKLSKSVVVVFVVVVIVVLFNTSTGAGWRTKQYQGFILFYFILLSIFLMNFICYLECSR